MSESSEKSESKESVHQLFETIQEELTDKAVSLFMDFGQAARFLLRNSSTSEYLQKAAKNFVTCEAIINSSNELLIQMERIVGDMKLQVQRINHNFNFLSGIEDSVKNCHSLVRIKTTDNSSESDTFPDQKATDTHDNEPHTSTTEKMSTTTSTSTEFVNTSTSTMMNTTPPPTSTTSHPMLSSPSSSSTISSSSPIQISSPSTVETIQTTSQVITTQTAPTSLPPITNTGINETEITISNQTKSPSSVTSTHIEETFKSNVQSKNETN